MHMYEVLGTTVLVQARSAQSDISATIQRHYAHEESPKRYICDNTAPLCA
jgi:hypothetical protein